MEAFDVEDFDCCGQRETARCQHDSAHHVEADPQAPGKLIAQVRGSAQPAEKAEEGAVDTGCHDRKEDRFPECEADSWDRHRPPPLCSSSLASASATSSRRWVIQ